MPSFSIQRYSRYRVIAHARWHNVVTQRYGMVAGESNAERAVVAFSWRGAGARFVLKNGNARALVSTAHAVL